MTNEGFKLIIWGDVKMICAYCNETAKRSKEHIISSCILDLFPECFVTIDSIRKRVYQSDPVIKDVCEKCNNEKLSYIDAYAKEIGLKYFLKKYEKDDQLEFNYNYVLIQKMLLKYAYNDLRSQKEDTSFFTEEVIEFLIDNRTNKPLKNITIIAGLAVNTSPVPDFIFGNKKIRWSKNPKFLSNSIIQGVDYMTGAIKIRNENPTQYFRCMDFSYLFRFNGLQFLLIGWDAKITDEILQTNQIVLECQYPYTRLDNSGSVMLSRCTSEVTYHFEQLIDVSWGQGILDDITYMRGTYSEESQRILKDINLIWKQEEESLAQKYLR